MKRETVVDTVVSNSARPIQWWLRDSALSLRKQGMTVKANILERFANSIDEALESSSLVVIDADSRVAVERLRDLYDAAWIEHHGYSLERAHKANRSNALQAALRSLIAPPRPEEPQGLGAVVEDAEGVKWLRGFGDVGYYVWRSPGCERTKYADISATRVLSEGVAEGGDL